MRYRDKAVHARNPEVLVAGRRRLAIVAAVVLVVLLAVGGWFLARCLRSSQSQAGQGAATQMDVAKQKKHVVKKAEPKEHHGNSPDCPDTDCIAMMVNGDLLFHPGLWDNFAGPNTAATDGTAYDFTSLFEPMRKYIDASDIAVCEFETPIAPRGGPYTGYPVFNIPSEVADAAAKVGYRACTHASNHSWDQGADGITRLWDTLDQDGIAQTGSYKTEEDSTKPLVIDSPTGGGKLGLIAGTVSLNAQTPDYDWRVDRLREAAIRTIRPTSTKPWPKPKRPVNKAPTWWPSPCIPCRNILTTPTRGSSPKRMSWPTPVRSTSSTVPDATARSPSRTTTARGSSTVWATP